MSITITTNDTNAFETFEISKELYNLYATNKLSKQTKKQIFVSVLEQITTNQLVTLKFEAEETTMTLEQTLEAVIFLALADYFVANKETV